MAATYTTRLNLTKPGSADNVDIDLIDSNFDLIDAAVGATVAPAVAKPASAFSGRMWFETDTRQFKVNTAASASTVASWAPLSPPGVFYVYNYGPMGGADDLGTIQLALNAASAAGGGYVDLGPGTFTISDKPDIWEKCTLRGAGMDATTLRSASAATGEAIRLRGASAAAIQDLTVDVNNRSGAIGILVQLAASATVATRHSIRRVRVKNALSNAVRVPENPTLDFTVEDCLFEDSRDGVSVYQVSTAAHKGVRIVKNDFRRIGNPSGFSHGVQLLGSSYHGFVGVHVDDNDMRDFTSVSTAIPIEINWADELTVDGNTIGSSATRGIGVGNGYTVTINGNTIVGQSLYAMEVGDLHGFTITGNSASACASLIHETDSDGMSDGVIAKNTFNGTAAASAVFGGGVIKLPWAKRVKVKANEITDWQYLDDAVRIGGTGTAEDVDVEGNTFVVTASATPISAITLRRAVRSSAKRNEIRIERNLVSGDDFIGTIRAWIDSASSDLTVEGNEIYFTGTTAAASSAVGITNGNVSASTLPGLTVRQNKVKGAPRGIHLVATSTDLIVESNDTRGCTVADVIPSTAVQAYQRPIYAGTGAPTIAGTTGDLYIRKDGGSGTWLYRCTSGTSWTAML